MKKKIRDLEKRVEELEKDDETEGQKRVIMHDNEIVGVSRGYTNYHQGRAIHMADSRIH